MKHKYILSADTFENKVFSICIFNRENELIEVSENISGEYNFQKRMEELAEYYNCTRIEEFELKESIKNRVYTKIPNISQAIVNYLKTDKGRQTIKDYMYKNDFINHKLLEELKNYQMKHTRQQSNQAKKNLKAYGDYMESDFYLENKLWYLNCKDNVGISAYDLQRTIIAEINEVQDEDYHDNLKEQAKNFGGL